ncbi:MAG: RES domain-containing protein, partial [Thiohalocapsa sp.]|uniref:RES family NAD+ phosphorylase n=1 Tax=Thiohalocapsa sp. TaxID=2497641 RepID=UPI0025F054A0
ADWRDPAARDTLRRIGAEWVRRRDTAILAVPSAVIPIETNYLLNPAHPNFGRVAIGVPALLETDLRLLR